MASWEPAGLLQKELTDALAEPSATPVLHPPPNPRPAVGAKVSSCCRGPLPSAVDKKKVFISCH